LTASYYEFNFRQVCVCLKSDVTKTHGMRRCWTVCNKLRRLTS